MNRPLTFLTNLSVLCLYKFSEASAPLDLFLFSSRHLDLLSNQGTDSSPFPHLASRPVCTLKSEGFVIQALSNEAAGAQEAQGCPEESEIVTTNPA
jgi:hypothetical protein